MGQDQTRALNLVRFQMQIQRCSFTLAKLPDVGIFALDGELFPWAYVDYKTVMSLHEQPEYYGCGLAKRIMIKLFHERITLSGTI